MASTGLASMPIELLVHIIATYLSTKDLGALRLTSKSFETALFDTFAKEFFTKKQFMLTTPSLTALVDISKHAALSKFVKHVIIGLEQYSPNIPHQITDSTRLYKYLDGSADQENLITTGRDCDLLAEAFRNLPNLNTIGIRDYNANGRTREGDAKWHSYGAPTVLEETGVVLNCTPSGSPAQFTDKVYSVLIRALAKANISIPSVEVILRHYNNGLGNNAFFLDPASMPDFDTVLNGLHTLLLTLRLARPPTHFGFPSMFANAASPSDEKLYLEGFLSHTANLKHLRLNFQHRQHEAPAELLGQLIQPESPVVLPHLEKLEFGMMTISPELLLQFITKFKSSLRFIGFWKVSLSYVRSTQLSNDSKPNPWRNFLLHVSRIDNLNLTGMMLGFIEQTEKLYSSITVRFSNLTEEESESLQDGQTDYLQKTRECKGDMDAFLPQLISNLRVNWTNPPVVIYDESDDGGGDEDDENDEEYEDEEMADENEGADADENSNDQE